MESTQDILVPVQNIPARERRKNTTNKNQQQKINNQTIKRNFESLAHTLFHQA